MEKKYFEEINFGVLQVLIKNSLKVLKSCFSSRHFFEYKSGILQTLARTDFPDS